MAVDDAGVGEGRLLQLLQVLQQGSLESRTLEQVTRALTLAEPSAVDAAFDALFAQLLVQDTSLHPVSALTRAQDAARNLVSGLSAAKGEGPPALAMPPHPPSFACVRLQTHVIALSMVHVAGRRGLPPGAAGRPPGRAVLPGGAPLPPAGGGSGKAAERPVRPPPVQHAAGQAASLQPCPIHTPLECCLTLRNVGRRRALLSVRPLQSLLEGGYLSVEPPSLALGRGETGVVTISLRLLHPGRAVTGLLVIDTEGGPRQVALVRAVTERTVFGVNLSDVPIGERPSLIGGYTGLPAPLLQLEARLCADGRACMDEEGVFRVAPTDAEKDLVRRQLDAGTFGTGFATGARAASGITTAAMVKVFLRELPSPIFSAIPKDMLLSAGDDGGALACLELVRGPAKTILLWLRDLLVSVASHEGRNKMSLKALAICTGPNLFMTDESVNPLEALMISQKAVALLLRLCQLAAGGGAHADGVPVTARLSVAEGYSSTAGLAILAPARAPVTVMCERPESVGLSPSAATPSLTPLVPLMPGRGAVASV